MNYLPLRKVTYSDNRRVGFADKGVTIATTYTFDKHLNSLTINMKAISVIIKAQTIFVAAQLLMTEECRNELGKVGKQ